MVFHVKPTGAKIILDTHMQTSFFSRIRWSISIIQKMMTENTINENMKIYNHFKDRFGNEYGFDNYMDFSKFWFNLSRKVAQDFFPEDFKELQRAAADSKEARTKAIV